MYKLQNGKLITPPDVYKGVIGYSRNLSRLTADGWKPLIETGDGESFDLIEHKTHIEKRFYTPKVSYREARAKAYPELGDVIDALLKAYEGNDKELKAIITQRNLIKTTIKKDI